VVVNVVSGHQPDPGGSGHSGQGVIPLSVHRVAVVPNLDQYPVPAEPIHQVV